MLVPDLQELSCPSCELSCLARLRVQAGCSLTAASHAAYADEHYIASHWIEQHSWLQALGSRFPAGYAQMTGG